MVKKKEYTGKKKVVSVGIKEELLVVAKAQAKKERRNFSNFIVILLEDSLNRTAGYRTKKIARQSLEAIAEHSLKYMLFTF